ncbi:hypothetical protein AAG906_005726 [Vitis piasezkii]
MMKNDANRCSDVLELIHMDICGPFPTPSWNGQQYFITFINDYSRYGYLYLIHEKSQSLDVFKNFKAEVENQLSKKIKTVKSDCGCEYYSRYDRSGEQRPGPFAKYLMECGIIPQYTMSRTPSQNGIAERRNRTLKDMVRSMIRHSTLLESLWGKAKPSIRHLHVWGCPAEARPYKPNEKKLDSRTVSCYFVGYSERSRGFKFSDPSTRSFFETGNAKFIEDVELNGREPLRKVVFEEEFVSIPIITTGHGHIMFDDTIQNVQPITEIVNTPEIPPTQVVEPVQVHKEEHEFDMGLEDDPISVSQVKKSFDSKKWIEAMKDEIKSMKDNGVWDLVKFPRGTPSHKRFHSKEGIDYKETFSPVSLNDSFRIIMALVAHYDLELHQVDVKIVFLNGNIDETIYMVQLENFESNDSKQLEDIIDQCIYLKFSRIKCIVLVLYVDDILLASSDVRLLHEIKRFLSSKFDMKDLGNASFVLGIQIYRDRSRSILGLSQKAYIDKVLSGFGMSNCAPGDTPMAKGDKFSLHQCLKNELEKKDMERFPYALVVGSLIYAQFLVVKERVQILQVSIEHISTNSIIADPLTKGLPPKVYHEHVTHMGVVHIDDVLV